MAGQNYQYQSSSWHSIQFISFHVFWAICRPSLVLFNDDVVSIVVVVFFVFSSTSNISVPVKQCHTRHREGVAGELWYCCGSVDCCCLCCWKPDLPRWCWSWTSRPVPQQHFSDPVTIVVHSFTMKFWVRLLESKWYIMTTMFCRNYWRVLPWPRWVE